jgi:XRE family transcriptional regulator, regulator of sulfur utilization
MAAAVTRSGSRVCWDVIGVVYSDVIEPGMGCREAGRMPASASPQRALGIAVAARRNELGLTQEQLSLRAELHQRWISNVETGKRNPSYASIRRLAAGLDITASELISRAERCESVAEAARPRLKQSTRG